MLAGDDLARQQENARPGSGRRFLRGGAQRVGLKEGCLKEGGARGERAGRERRSEERMEQSDGAQRAAAHAEIVEAI